MVKSRNSLERFCRSFEGQGLSVLGALELQSMHCPDGHQENAGCHALVVGNHGRGMWKAFSASAEFSDGNPDPMNRWTKRVLAELSGDVGCEIYHPSDQPYWPFQRIAQSAMGIKSSPLGILIHPEYGLWHALRGLLVFGKSHDLAGQVRALISRNKGVAHPCDACDDRPCLTACPVGAFTGERLVVESCFSHLDSGDEPDCMKQGCRARDACPVGILIQILR